MSSATVSGLVPFADYPAPVRGALEEIQRAPQMNGVIAAMTERRGEWGSEEKMILAGTAMNPAARAYLLGRLDELAAAHHSPQFGPAGEVIIGAGLHAAIYSAARVRAGHPKPVVLEDHGYYGGNFAMTRRPAFYLNSSNVPGLLGTPENGQALNYLPGAPVQPSDIGYSDFQVNSDIGFVVKLMLARYARVFTRSRVCEISPRDGVVSVCTDRGCLIAQRVIDARGLGDPRAVAPPNGRTLLSFTQFMHRADVPFPYRGMSRVAVIGGGAGGNVTVEALLGIGPMTGLETASLDYVRSVDWFGVNIPEYGQDWRLKSQRRYARIGTYLPERPDSPDYMPSRGHGQTRLTVIPAHGIPVLSTDSVMVNGATYDAAIMATGYALPPLGGEGYAPYRDLAAKHLHAEIYRVGPAASLPFSDTERASLYAGNPSNQNSIFRLANRTAALGTTLPATLPL